MTDTQATQIIAEVSEVGTPATNISQVILEVAYTPLYTKTHSIDALLSSVKTKTTSIDSLLSVLKTKNHSIDTLLSKTTPKTHSFDSYIVMTGQRFSNVEVLLKKTTIVSTNIDTVISGRKEKTTNIDSLLSTAPYPSSAKTHFLDALRIKSSTTFSRVDSFLFNSQSQLTYAVQAVLFEQTTIPADIETAFDQPIVRSALRLSRVISRNSAITNIPTITISDAGDAVANLDTSLINGYNRSSMKFAFADSDATTNDDYRIFPDFDKYDNEQYLEKQKIPWVSDQLTSQSGSLTPIVITIHYSSTNEFNMIELVTDKWGKGEAGIITDMDVDISTNGSSWTSVASGASGFACPDPHRYQLFYYYDQDLTTNVWSTDKEAFLENGDGYPLALVTENYIRLTINSISVDASASASLRPRHVLLYEAGAYLWDVGIQDVNITSFGVNEDRDLSGQNLSPVGTSNANTFSVTGTVAEKTTPYYTTLIDPYSPNHDQFQNALYIASVGVKIADNSYQYVDYGYYLADQMTISAPDGAMNISGRDFSKILQETKMPPIFYEDMKLHEVIHDIVERAGIEKFEIDITEYTIYDLSPYITKEWVSDDDLLRIHSPHMVWSNEQTCWEFLQTIAYADLGVFYFDRDNTFIYRAKEDLIRTSYTSQYSLSEDNDILNINSTNEIMKNAFKVSYLVPKVTDNPISLWDSDDQVLDATSLAGNINATQTTIPVGDISDWPEEGYIQLDNEIVKYKDRNINTFQSCERGWLGTRAVSHTMSNSSANWSFSGGTWSVAGGVLNASGLSATWETALTVDDIGSNRYNLYATVTINEDPFVAAVVVRAQGANNHYRFSFRTVKFPGIPGATAQTDANIYTLHEVVAGTPNLLKAVAFKDGRNTQLTGNPFEVRAQVDGKQLTFFVGGTRVMHYNIKDADLQVTMPAKIGLAAKSENTVFENVYVSTLPEDKRGETIVFSETFGKPIFEIRKFEIDYRPNRYKNKETIPPCSGVQYFMRNSDEFSVPYFEAGPFNAKIYVKNDTNRLAILSGTGNAGDTIPEFFYMTGYALYRNDHRSAESDNETLATRYGRQELNVELPWVESDTHAKVILAYIENLYGKATLFLDIAIAPNPSIRLGDIITLTSTTNEVWLPTSASPKFFVVGGQLTVDNSGGIKQNLKLRNVVE